MSGFKYPVVTRYKYLDVYTCLVYLYTCLIYLYTCLVYLYTCLVYLYTCLGKVLKIVKVLGLGLG